MFCGYGGGIGFGIGGILMIIFWVIIIWAIIAVIKALGHGSDNYHGRSGGRDRWRHMGGSREDDALRTLRDRYARGEITREEYEQRRADLERYY